MRPARNNKLSYYEQLLQAVGERDALKEKIKGLVYDAVTIERIPRSVLASEVSVHRNTLAAWIDEVASERNRGGDSAPVSVVVDVDFLVSAGVERSVAETVVKSAPVAD